MAEPTPQTYANHRRFDPPFHFFVFGAVTITFLYFVWMLIRQPGLPHAVLVLFMAAQVVLALKVRLYALKLQDRVIRLEERLRLAAVLPEPLRARAGELTLSQLIGLRFAPDAELPALVAAALDERLGADEIKRRIGSWRADDLRV